LSDRITRAIWPAVLVLLLCMAMLPRTGLSGSAGSGTPPRDYLILINYELGMHCTGFDFSYCCILPPYNSILAQVVKTERNGDKPVLLGSDPADPGILVDGKRRFRLAYTHEDPEGIPNTYSAKKKLAYWGVKHDGRELPSDYFSNLYFYNGLAGSNPDNTSANAKKKHVGIDTRIALNQGPTGQHVGRGFLSYSGTTGTTVFTDSPALENVPIKLSGPGVWEALGLPLTPFNDNFTSLITLDETMVQPYMRSVVTLVDADSQEPVLDSSGKPVRYFGLNPIDVPNCARCHSNERANGKKHVKYQEEYRYWKETRGSREWYAQLKAASISILELHDELHGTRFLSNWPAGSDTYTRLGRGAVICQDCHADNVVGRLKSRKVGNIASTDVQADSPNLPAADHLISPLTEAMHASHLRRTPLPDSKGFAGSCQLCHPAHRSNRSMENFPLTADGHNLFAKGDIRDADGCYTGRDVHDNPDRHTDGADAGSHLNAVGNYLLLDVMTSDDGDRGLYCTHCHNRLSRELYKADHLVDAAMQKGQTLRGESLDGIAAALGVSRATLVSDYLDPRVPLTGRDTDSGVLRTWDRHGQKIADIARIKTDEKGNPLLTAADVDGDRSVIIADIDPLGSTGIAVPYDAATHGRDYWLAPGEPHCADCHKPPYVESLGGDAFPIDQPGKYALMRYSRGHSGISCQGCHESSHGLYPVNPRVDMTSYEQAAMLNPDATHGPVKCGACHVVNDHGVPTRYQDIIGKDGPYWADYAKAVELQHTLR
jgi:mono/diheme cytochrome c family protein